LVNSATSLSGKLISETLFVGSKSEGVYPVLSLEQGGKYRVHIRGQISQLDIESLSSFIGKTVTLTGKFVEKNGHRVVVLNSNELPDVHLLENLNDQVSS